jgi:hypothetical protein
MIDIRLRIILALAMLFMIALAIVLIVLPSAAHAQIQPGPNISPGGIPFTYSPRFGYLGPPQPMPAPSAPANIEPPPAYAPSSPPPAPPPLGWVYTRYTVCPEPHTCPVVFVSVYADGLNVRATPDGPPLFALVNGTPLVVLDRQGQWSLVAAACELTPTWAWSWTANVPLNRCWI